MALKAEVNSSEYAPYTKEHIMMLTRDFWKLLRKIGNHQDLKMLPEEIIVIGGPTVDRN